MASRIIFAIAFALLSVLFVRGLRGFGLIALVTVTMLSYVCYRGFLRLLSLAYKRFADPIGNANRSIL